MDTNNRTPAKKAGYNKFWRFVIGLLALSVFVIGVTKDPQGFSESVGRIPTAFSTMVVWLGFTFLVGWWLIDMIAKRLVGKSLRELIEDKDPRFEQQLVIALVIAIPLLMLVSR